MHLKVFIMMSSSKKKLTKISICSWSNILTGKLHVNELCNERYCYHNCHSLKLKHVLSYDLYSRALTPNSALGRTISNLGDTIH